MNRTHDRVHRLMRAGVAQGVFPSACLLVAQDGQPLVHEAYGDAELGSVFDVASLTKPLCTTLVTLQLVAERRLSLQDPVSAWLPEVAAAHPSSLRIWHLLAHASGLPAWKPFYQVVLPLPPTRRRQATRRLAAGTPCTAAPGSRAEYSDLGFILLDWVLERCTGKRLDRLGEERLFGPLNLSRTFFVDLLRKDPRRDLRLAALPIVPTEDCPWRGRRLRGEVHDDNAHAMGGISGHAGLFSTAHDVHLLAHALVAAYHRKKQGSLGLFDTRTVRQFLDWPHRPAGSTRVLGWDTPSPEGSSCGSGFGPHTVGHLGFTGTSLWIDLDRRFWVVLLTNRVFHGRERNPMKAFRPRLHEAATRAYLPA